MPRAPRICGKPGCPLVTQGRYCAEHNREYEQRRGTTAQRGYGSKHQQARKVSARQVATGAVTCWRCGELIKADEAWDLGHDDDDRTKYNGPEHANGCNRSAGGKNSQE